MSWGVDDLSVGGQMQVGTGVCKAIKQGDNKINGSAHVEGPMVVGSPDTFFNSEATLMVAPCTNNDPDNETPFSSVGIEGNQPTALKTRGNVYIQGDLYVTGSTDTNSYGRLEKRHKVADSKPKLFDMKHPSKEGYRLAHACIEGPEVGVYYRGRVRNRNVIELPYYWKDLVHVESISVQLQPIGAHQSVIVKRWDDEKIYLQSNGGIPIDCFYHIYAERKDVNALVVEYEGENYEERPDKEGNDPAFSNRINTRTI